MKKILAKARVTSGLGGVVILALGMAVLSYGQGAKLSRADKDKVVAKICSLLVSNYVFPDTGKDISEKLRAHYDQGAYAEIASAQGFAEQLSVDLVAWSGDKHLTVVYDTGFVRQMKEAGPDEEEYLTTEEIEKEKMCNFGFEEVRILDGNVGYLDLSIFFHPKYAGQTAVAAMAFLSNCRAVIIDLRNNGGGWGTMVALLCSYFLDNEEDVHLMSAYWRPQDLLFQSWTLPYVPGKILPDVPLYILTSRSTFSAAEDFCYSLRQLGRVVIIGDRTRGGAHPVAYSILSDEFYLVIPEWTSFHPVTKANWEGVGIAPDIEVAAEKAFDVAYVRVLTQLRDSSPTSAERALYQWHLDGFQARQNPAVVDDASMRASAGKYGTLTISYEDGLLYYRRGDRRRYRMIPMSETLFLVDEMSDIRLRFKKEAGRVAAVVALFVDGTHAEYVRE